MSQVSPDDLNSGGGGVCAGNGGCLANAACCIPVLGYNAIDIYARPCCTMYLFQVMDGIFCAPFRMLCCACCFQHKDNVFPPDASSIGEWDGKQGAELDALIEWQRASQYFGTRVKDGGKLKLFEEGITPEDVAQGQLGNCWLIAAMACLAEHPGLLRKTFVTKRATANGKYVMNLFDGQERVWKNVTVDENIPVVKANNSLLFANPQGSELWVIMLEKAFAKFCGSYAALAGGHTLWAFHTVTGDPVFALKRAESGKWYRQNLKMTKDKSNKRAMSFYKTDEEYTNDDAFFLLRKLCRVKTLLGAAISNDGEMKRTDGLVAGHAYSVLDARSFSSSGESRINLVQLRNPWGAHEWNGAWSDGSKEWDAHPKIKNTLRPAKGNDGKFWIHWDDFSKIYNRIDVCQRSTGLRDLSLDVKEDDGCVGPCSGCCEGCASYWCGCAGCKALYCGVNAAVETMKIGPKGADDSMLVMAAAAVGGVPEGEEMER